MQQALVSVMSLSILTFATMPALAESRTRTVDPSVQANQQVLSAANKNGVRGQDIRGLAAFLKLYGREIWRRKVD